MKFMLFACAVFTATTLFSETNDIPQTKQTRVENGLRPKVLIAGESHSGANILTRMKEDKISGVTIAVVNDSKIEWAQGYGNITNDPKSARIDEHTLFQAASVSKPITAFGALILVQQGKVSLDEDVNRYLKRWKVPENEFTKTDKVTLRRLLSHTAGTNVHGFEGYSTKAPLPTIVDILQGKKPSANSEPVTVIFKPGTELKYSGGGTTIVQLLIEDITGERFDIWMQNNVLRPLDMLESTFTQPLPASLADHAAYGHHLDAVPVEGKWHVYPEMAAAGLWTTPSDLAQFIIYIQTALKGEKTNPLTAVYVKEIITRQRAGGKEIDSGFGLFLENEGKDLIFAHAGQNEGFIARLSGYAYRGQGIVIMMNNDSGWALMEEITNSVADTYHWPHFDPTEKKTIPTDPSSFSRYLGQYSSGEDELEVVSKNGKLFIDLKKGIGSWLLYRNANCLFFVQQEDMTIQFLNCDEKSTGLTITDSKGVKTTYNRKRSE